VIKQYIFLVLSLTIFVVACKEEENAPQVTFPEAQSLELMPGSQSTLNFTVSGGYWELYSNQPVWCRLSYDVQINQASVSGEEGSVTVQVFATDDLASFSESTTCNLVLNVAGQTKNLCTVTRKAYTSIFSLWQDQELLEPGTLLQLSYEGETSLRIENNFGTPVVQSSDWLEVSSDGAGSYTLSLDANRSRKYPIYDGYITFLADQIASVEYRYPVAFPGMDPEKIKITGYQYQPAGQNEVYTIPAYGWQVSSDGHTMTYVRPNGDVVVVPGTLSVTADALNDELVFAVFSDNRFVPVYGTEFYHIVQQQSNIYISVDALPDQVPSRSVSLYAFSAKQWESLANNIIDDESFYSPNALFSFSQQTEATGFEIEYYHWTDYEIYQLGVERGAEADVKSLIRMQEPCVDDGAIFTTHTAEVPVNAYTGNKALTVGILYNAETWNNATADVLNYRLIDLSTGADVANTDGYTLDAGLSQAGKWQFDLGFPGTLAQPLLLVIYDSSDRTQVLKALVIDNQ